ncbi:MAG: hypothetical protein ACJAZK_002360 [Psychroserpens sp.]|jgi:hypothetical protein
MSTQVSNTNVKDIRHQKKQSKRSQVVTSQYILIVVNRFIDLVVLELKKTQEQ